MMAFKQNKSGLNFFVLAALVSFILLILACGGGNSASDDSDSETGTLNFDVVYHGVSVDNLQVAAAVIDCAGEGVATVEATVYDSNNVFLVGGGPWDCDAGQGTISSVSAGSGRIVVIFGKESAGDVVFRGERSGINIIAGDQNNAGTIDCHAFVPSPQTPADGSVVNADAMGLSWDAVAGATEYRVVVSEHTDMTDPIIDDSTTEENYIPSGLSNDQTYYWQVFAIDAYDNSGMGSQHWSFAVDANHENTPPVVQIISPDEGSTYTAADTIAFSGSSIDREDGELSGLSLVWRSDVDGQIGTGEACASRTLVAGEHRITLASKDSEGATSLDSVTITIPPGTLPDTGQDTNNPAIIGEDADYHINPPAYTKLGASGSALDADAEVWAMVRDDVTGLIWEVKTDDGTIHNKNDKYTWQAAQDEFIAQCNSNHFGGHSDWRLPNTRELCSIVNKGTAVPAVDTDYFPNTVVSSIYWTPTLDAADADFVWPVYFRYGYISKVSKTNSNHVRAVRGAQKNASLIANDDDVTVTDTTTGLMWQKAEAGDMSWDAALAYCETLELAGYDDWRLPNYNELLSIVDYEKAEWPSINTDFFQDAKAFAYWSSTTYADDTDSAWNINFNSGSVYGGSKSANYYVRAVRGGQ